MGSQSAKRVWEVCEPHPDVFSRDPDPSLFAISLHHVARGLADKDYTDPERFFARTYMTRALSDLLERVVGRLAGQGRGAPILRLETPFGGGKTHTMTALFHIARSPHAAAEQEAVSSVLRRLGLSSLPGRVRVAVLDGRGLDVRERRTEEGVTIRTLWGELAYQLGGLQGYGMLADADETRTSPGGQRLTEVLARYQPVLILMDEVLEYLIKARAVKVNDSNLMEQTGTFLGDLSSAVSAVPQAVLVVALPASSLEVAAENQEVAERLFQYAKKVLGRMELVETPVAQDEVFGVLRRRLFRSLGNERDHRRAVEAMRDYYEQYARFFPDRLRSPDYKERMLQAYPFHPELIDLLYERWGPHPQFQRTRGALRLLALALRRIWNQRPGSAIMLQPCHIDLRDRYIRGEVIRLLDSGWDAIVTGDVLERASEIERELGGDYAREQLGVGAATCVFLYSISAATGNAGLTEIEIRTALLRPNINTALISEVLSRLREKLWFLRYREGRYLFTAKPNPTKVILDFEAEIGDEAVDAAIKEHLDRLSGKDGTFLVAVAPERPELVPDRAQPTLVVLPLDVTDAPGWMHQAVQRSGEGQRINRNMLVFLVPDTSRLAALRASVKRLLALRKVEGVKSMDPDDMKHVEEQRKDKEKEVEALLRSAYRQIYRPDEGGSVRMVAEKPYDAGTFSQYVAEMLRKAGILVERLAPEFMEEMLRAVGRGEATVSQIMAVVTGAPGQPLIERPERAISEAVREGVQKGQFAVKVGEKIYRDADLPEDVIRESAAVVAVGEVAPEAPPVPEPVAAVLKVSTTAKMLYPLLKVAEIIRNAGNASVRLEVCDTSGEIARHREELERLLKDYGCSFVWEPLSEGQHSQQ
jgi:hypothetical protein